MNLNVTSKEFSGFAEGEDVTYLLNFLQEGKRLLTLKNDANNLLEILTRTSFLKTTLSDNERGCSQEELNKVAEIVTGSSSSKLVVEDASVALKEGQKTLAKLLDTEMESMNLFYDKMKEYLECLGKKYQTVLENKKITTFSTSYPSFKINEKTGLPCEDLQINLGSSRVDSCISEYNTYAQKFENSINEFFKNMKEFKKKDDLEQTQKFFSESVEHLHDAAVILLKHRNWILNELSK